MPKLVPGCYLMYPGGVVCSKYHKLSKDGSAEPLSWNDANEAGRKEMGKNPKIKLKIYQVKEHDVEQ